MASLIAGHGHPAGGPNGIIGVAPQAHILSIRAVTDQGDPGDQHYEHESEAHVQGAPGGRHRLRGGPARPGDQHVPRLPGRQPSGPGRHRARPGQGHRGGRLLRQLRRRERSARGGNAPYSFPADYPGVLGVAAVGRSEAPAHFSSNNLSVQVAAPGVKVPAQGRDGQYWLVSGTSPACALTAGVAALIKSRYPALPPALVEQAITASTWHRPHGGYNEEVGFGTVDAAAALTMAARLARDAGAGRGLAAAAMFGGGPSAIPPLPVAPRGRRQLIIDTMLALACLALLAASAFWLTWGRSARPAWPGAAQPASGPPLSGWPVPGPPAAAPPGLPGRRPPGRRSPGRRCGMARRRIPRRSTLHRPGTGRPPSIHRRAGARAEGGGAAVLRRRSPPPPDPW